VALLETSLVNSRHINQQTPPIVKQLFFCGDYSDNSKINHIITRGFTKQGKLLAIFNSITFSLPELPFILVSAKFWIISSAAVF
jgi:hypothetical protein